jgi:hypothetical protein
MLGDRSREVPHGGPGSLFLLTKPYDTNNMINGSFLRAMGHFNFARHEDILTLL